MSSEPGFIKCPQCGELDERRLTCKCGYRQGARGESPAVVGKKPILLRILPGGVRWFFVLLGLGAIYWGYQEYRIGASARMEPTELDLAALEAGDNPPQNHIRLGEHWRLYADIIY